ncbi:MAG TPA: SAM-dependent methyltransferase [Flexivirga sp.]|uniref:SAM-dependent methyltransferase n=1 Tax=Flexivirga sp. TaxID=1962927 RepID=UPI002D045C4B|nr:SAM-dependent methyltransferase [Flexivirga sp.]HWC24901.1 SAM-dependent methyltransferase [Flexivirga sp.]
MVWQSWRSAWHDALYGPDGFYRQVSGPAGHFATSAQGIPGGGRLLARALVILAERSGCTRLVDVGAGRGELLAEVAAIAPGLRLTGVDVVERPAELPEVADWLRSPGGTGLPDDLRGIEHALVIAHEWLDVVPCTIAEYDGAVWRTVEVDPDGDERLADPVAGSDLQWLQQNWRTNATEGDRAEIGTTRDAAFRELRARIDSGVLVAVDYGHLRDDRPEWGTLTGYRDGVQCPPRPDGSTDITAHVAMDTLGADELVCQHTLFDRLGLRPEAPAIALASEDPPAYLRALAERGSYAQLTATGGLGDFWWAITRIDH